MKACALCGQMILDNSTDPEEVETDEHVPPRQFFPKAMRPNLRDRLWKVPTHRRCNQKYKLDEEYFLHSLSPLVASTNQTMGQVLLEDAKRRAKKPQYQGLTDCCAARLSLFE